MKLAVNRLKLVAATTLCALVVSAAPALALAHGDGSNGNPGRGSDHTAQSSADDNHQVADDPADDAGGSSGTDSIHDRAQQALSQAREQHTTHTAEVRQKVCQNRENTINTRLSTLGTRAQRHLDVFNAIFARVQTFQAKRQLAAADYDNLVAAATAKQTVATAAVANLKALSGTKIDCAAADPAATLANVKTAANDAKTALQTYRQAIKDVIKALQSANANANTSTDENTGGNQ